MTKKIILILVSLLMFIYPVTYAQPSIQSPSAILMEATTGKVIYEKNSNERHYPASITKILTAIIAIEETDLNETVVIGDDVPHSITSDSSAIYLLPGEKLTIEQLLYALTVESANDAAVAIADYISGSVEDFSVLMNKKAKELGATQSHFVTPNGLHNDDHYVTAHDMGLIMREAIKHPILREMMTTVNYVIPATEKQITRYLWTKNKMLKIPTNKYYYDKIIATKTGYTTEAQYTLVSAAQENGMELVTVVLASNSTAEYEDTLAMFQYGFSNFTMDTLVNKGDLIENYEFQNNSTPLKVISNETVSYVVDINNDSEITSELQLSNDLSLPIHKGQAIGTIEYILDGEVIGQAHVIAGNEIKSNFSHFSGVMGKILLWVLTILVTLFLLIRIAISIHHSQVKKKRYKRNPKNEYSRY
ncbi:MAG: D-alanyl-D-alanine carboxypeptidase family protein [Eubacteriales bacterium]